MDFPLLKQRSYARRYDLRYWLNQERRVFLSINCLILFIFVRLLDLGLFFSISWADVLRAAKFGTTTAKGTSHLYHIALPQSGLWRSESPSLQCCGGGHWVELTGVSFHCFSWLFCTPQNTHCPECEGLVWCSFCAICWLVLCTPWPFCLTPCCALVRLICCWTLSQASQWYIGCPSK